MVKMTKCRQGLKVAIATYEENKISKMVEITNVTYGQGRSQPKWRSGPKNTILPPPTHYLTPPTCFYPYCSFIGFTMLIEKFEVKFRIFVKNLRQLGSNQDVIDIFCQNYRPPQSGAWGLCPSGPPLATALGV